MMEERIEAVLEEIRPALARHSGDVEFVSFEPETGHVCIRLKGTCKNCPLADMTVTLGIESVLCERLPEVSRVLVVE